MPQKYDSKIEARSVFTIFSQRKIINTNPMYQRGEVWTYKNKKLFIDSLIKGIIPNNIIINKITNRKGMQNNCIDGKQRMTSIFEFMKNKYPVIIEDELVFYSKIDKDYDRKQLEVLNRKKEFRIMTQKEKSEFGDNSLSIAVYKDLAYQDEAEIFERIQHGLTLQTGEKIVCKIRNKDGVKIFSSICADRKEQLKNLFTKDAVRDKDKDFISKIIFMIMKKSYSAPSSTEKDAFLKEFTDKEANKVKNKIEGLFDFFFSDRLFNHINCNRDIDNNYLLTVMFWMFDKFKKNYVKILGDDKQCNILLNLFKGIHEMTNSKKLKRYSIKNCEKLKDMLDVKYDELSSTKKLDDILNTINDNDSESEYDSVNSESDSDSDSNTEISSNSS